MSAKKHIFSQIEKKLFMDILKSYSAVVENKNTDSTTLREKNTAWENITREYNASPHVTTEVTNKQLRRLWMNLKQRQRDAITKERQHRMATGGGPSTSGAEIDPDVAVIAPALLVEIPGAIDSDAAFLDSEDASMDIDSNQPDLSQDSTLQQPSTSAAATLQQPSTSAAAVLQPDQSPILFPTTTTPPSPLSMILPPSHTTTPPPRIITPPPPRTITTPPPPRTITIPPPRSSATPPPRSSTTPPPHSATSLPPPSLSSTASSSFQQRKQNILEKEYRDRFVRAGEIHALEKELLSYKIREAKAKAELAELILQRERGGANQREGTE